MDLYSYPLRPESFQPSGCCDFSRIYDKNKYSIITFNKNKFYFSDFGVNQRECKIKYNNNWNELREYVGLNDIELIDNELVIVNLEYIYDEKIKQKTKSITYAQNYNVFRIMSGSSGLAY